MITDNSYDNSYDNLIPDMKWDDVIQVFAQFIANYRSNDDFAKEMQAVNMSASLFEATGDMLVARGHLLPKNHEEFVTSQLKRLAVYAVEVELKIAIIKGGPAAVADMIIGLMGIPKTE